MLQGVQKEARVHWLGCFHSAVAGLFEAGQTRSGIKRRPTGLADPGRRAPATGASRRLPRALLGHDHFFVGLDDDESVAFEFHLERLPATAPDERSQRDVAL